MSTAALGLKVLASARECVRAAGECIDASRAFVIAWEGQLKAEVANSHPSDGGNDLAARAAQNKLQKLLLPRGPRR